MRLKAGTEHVSRCDGGGTRGLHVGERTENDRVGREHGELGMQLVEEVKLVCCAANGSGEEKDVALQPRHLGGGVLKADTGPWLRHLAIVQFDGLRCDIAGELKVRAQCRNASDSGRVV